MSSGDEVWYSALPYRDTLLGEDFELPAVLRKIRQESRKLGRVGEQRTKVVIYSNPRGSNPNGVDACTSYRELERAAKAGTGAMSWSEAGTLDATVSATDTTLLLRAPKILMAGARAKLGRCVIVPSHPLGADRGSSTCHVDAVERPKTGWVRATRNAFYFTSLLRVGDEVMTVLNATDTMDSRGDPACRLVVRRQTAAAAAAVAAAAAATAAATPAVAHEVGEHALAPTHLDAEASAASCETPVQYAFDYTDQAASACIERHLEHALAVGADGTWLDNMGPNLYGAKTASGVLLGSYDPNPNPNTSPNP